MKRTIDYYQIRSVSTAEDEDEAKIFSFLDEMEVIGINFPLMLKEGKRNHTAPMQLIKEDLHETSSPYFFPALIGDPAKNH